MKESKSQLNHAGTFNDIDASPTRVIPQHQKLGPHRTWNSTLTFVTAKHFLSLFPTTTHSHHIMPSRSPSPRGDRRSRSPYSRASRSPSRSPRRSVSPRPSRSPSRRSRSRTRSPVQSRSRSRSYRARSISRGRDRSATPPMPRSSKVNSHPSSSRLAQTLTRRNRL